MSTAKLPKLEMKTIKPLTDNQRKVFDAFESGKNLFINGSAGTGKTFISLYLALRELQYQQIYGDMDTIIQDITIVRSAVPSRDMGFLPGNLSEKLSAYEHPYRTIVDHLFNREGAYNAFKEQGYINFSSTSYLRGLTLDNTIVIIDEIANLTFRELNLIFTRLGENARTFFVGDFFQSDLKGSNERNGVQTFMKIIDRMNSFAHIEMSEDDIVRSKLIREYIIQMNQLLYGRMNIERTFAIAT